MIIDGLVLMVAVLAILLIASFLTGAFAVMDSYRKRPMVGRQSVRGKARRRNVV